jgi:acetyl coenzyme A synthetase (ADP forming)-like protein
MTPAIEVLPETHGQGLTKPFAAVEVVLRDGSTVHVREIAPDDRVRMRAFLGLLSKDSRWLRFFSGGPNLDNAADAAAGVSYPESYGIVATRGEDRIVAHATYVRAEEDRAEVAFAVADELQGMGIATTLLAHLAEAADADGIGWFEAVVLPENHRMAEVFRESGFTVRTRSVAGMMQLEFPTVLGPDARRRFDEREGVAATAAVRTFLAPPSTAVIGASERPGSVGHETLHNMLRAGYTGRLSAVNPHAGSVLGVPTFRSIGEVSGPVELAVIAVPASSVLAVARECAAKGVKALVVLSAGFGESGASGAERQHLLLDVCRRSGMRLVGPNCLGVINTDPAVRLNATFAPSFPPPGRVGFLSQSGALGLAVIDHAQGLGLGLSSFVSNGNKADISGNDLLEYWEQDEATQLIVLYLESFGNPRKFARIARRVGAHKPILAVKSGRSKSGARATGSHTGALIAASDVTVDALFRQAGVIRTDTLSELFDVAKLLDAQPVPAGARVGLVTNAGGLGIMCADACEASGLEVPDLPAELQAQLEEFLPPTASTSNPVDMIATAGADDYRRSIETIAASGAVDAIVAIFIPPLVTKAEDVADAICGAVTAVDRSLPVVSVFASHEPAPEQLRAARVPNYAYPEDAARALAKAANHGHWIARDPGTVRTFDGLRPDEAAAVIASALERDAGWLEPPEVATLLSCYGLPTPKSALADTPAAAGEAAERLGGPVAVKAVAPTLVHKTDPGGVVLGLVGGSAVTAAAREMHESAAAAGHAVEGYLVQQMAPAGVEMLVGVVHDPLFGPVVACGGGGTTAELIGDVAVRLSPVTDCDANEMVRSLRTYPLLRGYRGAKEVDVDALEDVVLRLAAMVDEHAEITEVDMNPAIVSTDGAQVVDARIRVQHAPPRQPWPAVGV